MRSAPCAVAVAPCGFRRRYAAGPRVIGLGFDGSQEARAALRGAAWLALDLGAELRLVSVVESERLAARTAIVPGLGAAELIRPRSERLGRELDEALAGLPTPLAAAGAVVSGDPARVLAGKAAGWDLLALGSHGRGAAGRALLGSVSAALARSVSCPLLVYPRWSAERSGAAGAAPREVAA
jgi:nucleotide-binding universal stress UspA family protein